MNLSKDIVEMGRLTTLIAKDELLKRSPVKIDNIFLPSLLGYLIKGLRKI